MSLPFSGARLWLKVLLLAMPVALWGTEALAAADLSVTNACASSGGQSFLCTVTVTNIGDVASVAPLSITDTLSGSGNATLLGAGGTLPASCSPGAQVINDIPVSCPKVNVSLAPKASGTFLISYSIPQGDKFTNCVSVSAAQNAGSPGDPNTLNNLNICTTFSVAQPVLTTTSITIVKDAQPNDGQDFAYVSSQAAIPAFALDDDSDTTLPSQKTFSGLSAGIYSFTETQVKGWLLSGLTCSGGIAITSKLTGTATITLAKDDNVTCTFTSIKGTAAADGGDGAALPADQVFDWAESQYPTMFPSQETTQTQGIYQYRYYPATDLYLGLADSHVYLMGKAQTGGKILHIGAVSEFAAKITRCDQAAKLDARGNAVLPAEAFEIEAPESVDEDEGSLSSLYPELDTTTDAFYPNLPCEPSIGGTLPATEQPSQDVIDAEKLVDEYEEKNWNAEAVQALANSVLPVVSKFDTFTAGDCFTQTVNAAGPVGRKQVDCNSASFLNAAAPFEGRDIIYVHGFNTEHNMDRIANPTGPASKLWPADASEFLNAGGYFRTTAESYWTPHLIEHLSAPSGSTAWPGAGWQWTGVDAAPIYAPKPNRYLVVAWNTNQTIEYAQHALLTQIYLAITANRNVVTPATFPAGQVRPFCSNGCIIIGHSTGPLIISSAFGRAANGDFGAGGRQIASKVLVHVSMDGARSGSRIATAGLAAASLGGPALIASNVLCAIAQAVTGSSTACNTNNDMTFLFNSILRDLVPVVSQVVWGNYVNMSPVPTVTIAGGHPRGNQALGLTQWLLPGVDDGVVTMNSACANPNPVFPHTLNLVPSGITVLQPVKAFEFSEWLPRLVRGTKLWTSQNNLMATGPQPGYLAGTCTPYLNSAGMVMPVAAGWANTPRDARNRYRNHYSFMQSLAEHSYDGGGSPIPSLWPSYTGGAASELRQYAPLNVTGTTAVSGINVEESRVVTDPSVYTMLLDSNGTHLIKPVDMRVVQRGRRLNFHMPFNIGNCTKQGALRYYCHRWIWKRTYHLADKWEQKQSSHYVYEFVGRR